MDKYTKSLILGLVVGIFAFAYSMLIDQQVAFPNQGIRVMTAAIVTGLFAFLVAFLLNHFNQPKK